MTTYTMKRKPEPLDLLDRLLNHTTLTTKKVAHEHILGMFFMYFMLNVVIFMESIMIFFSNLISLRVYGKVVMIRSMG